MAADALKATIKVCMFDQYGTVVDMQKGLTEAVGHRAVAYTLERAGIPHTMDEVHSLVAQIERLTPFPDVPEALARLKTRYRIVVLSNGDPDMLDAAKAFHKIQFDAVISVAVASSFKPHVATYTKAAQIVGVRMDEVLFVANHAFDCIGAKAAGMHTAFIDRRRRPFGATPHQPDIVAPDMKSLAGTKSTRRSARQAPRLRRVNSSTVVRSRSADQLLLAIAAARRFISSGGTSSLCVPTCH
jgi:2-haloacid dehalogenase